jgi:hypothetical protein
VRYRTEKDHLERLLQPLPDEEEVVLETPSSPEVMPAPDLLRELVSNGSLLVKRQLKLAELEAKRDAKKERTSLEILGVAGVIAHAAVLMMLVAAAMGIGDALGGRYWAGALIVSAALLGAAAILAPIGWWRRVRTPLPKSRGELQKELTWANTQLTT